MAKTAKKAAKKAPKKKADKGGVGRTASILRKVSGIKSLGSGAG